MNQLEQDIIEMAMYKVACYDEGMEKTATPDLSVYLDAIKGRIRNISSGKSLRGGGLAKEKYFNKLFNKKFPNNNFELGRRVLFIPYPSPSTQIPTPIPYTTH